MAGCKPGKHGPEDLSHIQIVRILFSQKKCRKHFFNIGWLRTAKTDNSALCRKASSNTSVSFCSARILRYFYVIMVPQSVRRCRKEGTIESWRSILFSEVSSWYNSSKICAALPFCHASVASGQAKRTAQRTTWAEEYAKHTLLQCRNHWIMCPDIIHSGMHMA